MRTRVAVGLVGLALAACDGDVTGTGATEGAGGHGVGGFGGATAGTGGAHAGGGATTGAGGQGGATTGAGGHGGATTTGAGGQGGAGLPTGAIEIGFWCGPPKAELTDARFAEIAAAGFTFVANACDGATFEPGYNGAMLALAGQHGLRAIVSDARAGQAVAGQSVDASLDGLVKDYAGAPALYGYHLVDEPGVPAFGAIAAVVAGLRARDPAHPGVVNLLPDYATPGQLGAPDYPAYVGAFLDTVKPAVFTYDHYNFLADGSDGPTFFANLAAVRAASIAHGVPFGQYIQAISYVGHRATTGPEKRWAALHTLAYGGTGVMYFTYWTPPQTQEQFGSGIVAADGALTPQYAEVSDINRSLAAMGRYLAAATSTGVFHNGPLAAGTAPRAPGAIAYVPSAAPWTVGLFSVGADAYALVVNRDHAGATESDVILATADGAPEVLDVASGAFVPAQVAPDPRGARVHLALAPGDGALFHLRGPLPAGPPGAEAYFGTVRADAGWLDVVDASFGTARLRPAGWDDCPAGTVNVGKDFQSYGFWLCARQDLAARRFFVGNVVADAGHGWILEKGTATSAGGAGWDQCPIGALLGHRFESNGFWVCME